ncbi:MAG: porin [Heteroscytonema crispum UTEX LB 1556]
MSQTIFDCHKFTLRKQFYKVYLLLCTALISMFWILGASDKSSAQVNRSNQVAGGLQLGLGELLPVPRSPVPSGKVTPGLQTVPPPPGALGFGVTSASSDIATITPFANPIFQLVQQAPSNQIKQLENAFIQQQTPGNKPKAKYPVRPSDSAMLAPKNQVQTNVLLSATGGDSTVVGSGQQNLGQFNALVAQLPPLPSGAIATREFTAPNVATGLTFNSQPNSQVAPLPPLPGEPPRQQFIANAAPTFNQLLNAQGGITSTSGAIATQEFTAPAAPTFNQLLNPQGGITSTSGAITTQEFTAPAAPTVNQLVNTQPQVAPLPPLPGTSAIQQVATNGAPTFKGLLDNQGGTQPVSGTTAPTFNQIINAQSEMPPGVSGGTAAPTFNQIINAQSPMPPDVSGGTAAPTFNQITNAQSPMPPDVSGGTAAPTFNQILNNPGQGFPANQVAPAPQTTQAPAIPQPVPRQRPAISSTALKEPSLILQGVYVTQGGDSSARARVSGIYPVTPQILFGATLDLTSENSTFDDSRRQGLNINELYFATSLTGLPNLRFVVGQMDLTSYFDRNSFAKDGASQFFNPVFQTNPALAATGIASRPGLLVNWSVTDSIEAKAAVFSSADRTSEFTLDGFAGEIGIRNGNLIIRGTYASDRDSGNGDSFAESFSLARNSEGTEFGTQKNDREEAYGLNAEVFIPNLKLGLFGRYGRYENRDLGKGADTYVFGASFVDLFTADDRLGLAYGRALSNDSLRRGENPDVLELFYDFKFLPNLRLGLSVQGRDSFEETVLGVRVKTEFDVTPRGRIAR